MSDPKVKIKVEVDGSKAVEGVSRVSAQLGRLREAALSIPGVGTALLAVGSAAGIAAGAFAGMKRALDEFAEAEEGVARLEAALANSGQSTAENRQQLKALAEAMQEATGIADDQWLGAITRLIQAGSNPASIGMDLEAVKNLTAVVGNLSAATVLYAQALAGNFGGFRTHGILIDETATATEKLAEVQEQAARRGAGILEASTRTLTGRFRSLWNAVANAAEATGQWGAKTGILQAILWSASQVLNGYANAAGQAYDELGLLNKQTEGTAEALKRYRAEALAVLRLTQESVKAINAEVEAMRQKQSLLDQLTDKQAAMEKAQVDLLQAEGKITPQQAVRRKAQIDVNAAREKAKREIEQANLEQKKQEEAVAILEEQKSAVDADLKRETAALKKDEKRARLRQIVEKANPGFAEEETAGGAAKVEVGLSQFWRGIRSTIVARMLLGEPEDARPDNNLALWEKEQATRKANQAAFVENALRLTDNNAEERRGRVDELQTMSGKLGVDLVQERSRLTKITPVNKTRVAIAEADTATAELNAATQITTANRSGMDGGIREAQMLPANLSAGFKAWEAAFKECSAIAIGAHQKGTNALSLIRQTKHDIETQRKNDLNR